MIDVEQGAAVQQVEAELHAAHGAISESVFVDGFVKTTGEARGSTLVDAVREHCVDLVRNSSPWTLSMYSGVRHG